METWQVYGMDGELLAEYAASGSTASPQKEYGYRNGQLLITATPSPRTNVALSSNGATATASSYLTSSGYDYLPSHAINGTRYATFVNDAWLDGTFNTFPDWIEVSFNGSKTISEIDVFTTQADWQNPVEPTPTQTFTPNGGITVFEVQYWNGSSWVTVPGGSISGNDKVWRQISFPEVTTSKIRVLINDSLNHDLTRVAEVEAWGFASGSANINWLVADQLGTPRMVLDKTGTLAAVKRHDYLPFGEELVAAPGLRTTTLGYTGDAIRQKFTSKERDNETGLDYFLARYSSSTQGRFMSPDEFARGPREVSLLGRRDSDKQALAYADIFSPQSLNKYHYCLNNPLRYIDPDGHDWRIVEEKDKDGKRVRRYVWDSSYTWKKGDKNGARHDARYLDTQGRAIQLWGNNSKDPKKEQTHGYQVVTAESTPEDVGVERLTDGTGALPTSYSNVADTEKALLQAGYKHLSIDPFHSGTQFFKETGPTLHIIVAGKQAIVEDNRSGFTTYRARHAVDRVEFHVDRFSQVNELGAHMKEATKQFFRVQ